jgi:hypothetical protein
MSQTKLTHVQQLHKGNAALHDDLNAEFLALSKFSREALLIAARRILILERQQKFVVVALLCVAAVLLSRL